MSPRDPKNTERWLVAIAVMSSAVMEVLDTSVVNVSLPHIAGSLSATVDEATWVLTSYIVANAIILPLTGWLANYVGRKRLLLTVVTGFTLSSVLCGLAPNLPALIFFRVMQGTTGGGLQPLSQAVLLEEFPPEMRGTAMGFWGLGIVAAPILGPTLGGWITDHASWRWVFYINLPIGIASLILISMFVHDPSYITRGERRIDLWGIGMLAIGMGSLQVFLDKGQEDDWFASHAIVALFIFAVVGLTAFVVWEWRRKDPLVDFHLMKDRTFSAGLSLAFLLGFVLYGSLIILPLFLQTLLGFTATQAGVWTSPRGIGTAALMPIVGYLLGKRVDGRWMVFGGSIVASFAMFGFSHMNLNSGTWNIFWHQINQGVGMAFIFVPLTTLTVSNISKEKMGFATSLYSVMRNIGSSVGISFSTTMIARRSQFHQNRLTTHITAYNGTVRQFLQGAAGRAMHYGAAPGTAAQRALAMLYGMVLQQASLLSFLDVFHVMGVIFVLMAPLAFIMRKATHAAPVEGVH